MPLERLWTDQQLISLDNTVKQLRRTRTVATSPDSEKGFVGRLLHRNESTPIDRQAVLLDARNLANNASDFFAAKISQSSDGEYEFELWQDTLSDSEKRYKGKQTTYARTQPVEVGLSMISTLRLLTVDKYSIMKFWLADYNNLGITSPNELDNSRIGVVAPLSGDYLMASLLRNMLLRSGKEGFPLRLAALNSKLDNILFEEGQMGEDFKNLPAIGIFLDAIQTTNTGNIIYAAVHEQFPTKDIYKPKITSTEFKPSSKIRKFMNQK
jgi:hypothetical protein